VKANLVKSGAFEREDKSKVSNLRKSVTLRNCNSLPLVRKFRSSGLSIARESFCVTGTQMRLSFSAVHEAPQGDDRHVAASHVGAGLRQRFLSRERAARHSRLFLRELEASLGCVERRHRSGRPLQETGTRFRSLLRFVGYNRCTCGRSRCMGVARGDANF